MLSQVSQSHRGSLTQLQFSPSLLLPAFQGILLDRRGSSRRCNVQRLHSLARLVPESSQAGLYLIHIRKVVPRPTNHRAVHLPASHWKKVGRVARFLYIFL